MSIQSVCKTDVITIQRGATLKEAAQLMKKQHVGSLIVTVPFNGKPKPIGIITDRDIALAIANTQKPQKLMVENIMVGHPTSVKSTWGIYETIGVMKENGIKRMPVVREDGSLMGIVCSDDLLALLGEEISDLSKISPVQIEKEKGARMPYKPQAQAI